MAITKKKKLEKLPRLKKRAWVLMSEWVRRKDADSNGMITCFTCGSKHHWKSVHCGHFIHNHLNLDERNLKSQCVKCNTFLRGNLGEYAVRLIKQYDIEWLDKLKEDAFYRGNNYRRDELEEIIADLKEKLKKLSYS